MNTTITYYNEWSKSYGFVENGFNTDDLNTVWASNDRIDTSKGISGMTTNNVNEVYKEYTGTTLTWDSSLQEVDLGDYGDLIAIESEGYYLGDYPSFSNSNIWSINSGRIHYNRDGEKGIRPVLTLKAGVMVKSINTGDGSSADNSYTLE